MEAMSNTPPPQGIAGDVLEQAVAHDAETAAEQRGVRERSEEHTPVTDPGDPLEVELMSARAAVDRAIMLLRRQKGRSV